MLGVGLSGGSLGVLEAYEGLIDYLFVDDQDENDRNLGEGFGVTVVPGNTRLDVQDEGASFAAELLTIVAP
jgi:hypothetical protein